MMMSSFGSIQISVLPKAGDPATMELTVITENRKETIKMDLRKDENVDNFASRIKSVLRGLMTAPTRTVEALEKAKVAEPPTKSFEELRAALTGPPGQPKTPSGPVRA